VDGEIHAVTLHGHPAPADGQGQALHERRASPPRPLVTERRRCAPPSLAAYDGPESRDDRASMSDMPGDEDALDRPVPAETKNSDPATGPSEPPGSASVVMQLSRSQLLPSGRGRRRSCGSSAGIALWSSVRLGEGEDGRE